MRHPFSLSFFAGKREADASRFETVRSLFSKFRRIQKLNTRALERMAEMERALGGEYIFDRTFLECSVRDLSGLVYQVVYSLNALSENHHVELFDRFEGVKGVLADILGGGAGPYATRLTLPYSALGWGMEPLAGELAVCLAEIRNHLDVPVPDGFVVTVAGCRRFTGEAAGKGASAASGSSTGTPLPQELDEAVRVEMKALQERCGGTPPRLLVRARLVLPDAAPGTQSDFRAVTVVFPGEVPSACRTVLSEFLRAKAAGEVPPEAEPVLSVQEDAAAFVVGSVALQASPDFPAGLFRVEASLAAAPERVECTLLRRVYPFEPVRSDVFPKPALEPLYPGVASLSLTPGGLYRGSALLGPNFLHRIAEVVTAVERLLGAAPRLLWARDHRDRPVILDVLPFEGELEADPSICAIGGALDDVEVLMKGGEVAQAGISAGRCVHVLDPCDVERFPYGAVAVARLASPGLSPVLRRASAVVTEVGTSIGHLATIARELRVPALFGAAGALGRIPDGAEVTVDAGERTVYRGIVEALLAGRGCGAELYPTDPEYVLLRRLLHWIQPLRMVDPDAADFKAANCRTFHDILHYAHECSVDELLDVQERGRSMLGAHAKRLEVGVPIDLFVVDIGGGLAPGAGDTVTPAEIVSEPFRAFLEGLGRDAMWSREPVPLSLKDIFSGLDRTFAAMTTPAGHAGKNHAIIAANYMNVGLRLGYHYSIVDSTCDANPNQNTIYFRFAGGFADAARRRRRAELLRSILEGMRFKVDVDGDLVVARLKIAERDEMMAALVRIGELTGFTRQLDLAMTAEEMTERFAERFRMKSLLSCSWPGAEEGRHE